MVLLFPPLLTPVPKNGETMPSQANGCRRAQAARTNCCSSFQLQTECKPKHCWWKPPNTLFRNSSAHVLCFLSHLNDHNYEVTCILKVYHHSIWELYKNMSGMTQNTYHSRTYCLLLLIPHFRCIYWPKMRKKRQMNSRKTASCFQARFRSETKLTSTDPTSHEEQVAIPKATHEASFAGKTL